MADVNAARAEQFAEKWDELMDELGQLRAALDAIERQCNLSELSEREKAKHDPRHMYYPTLHTSIIRAYLRSDGLS